MKTFLLTFLAVLLAASLALFVYDRFVLVPRMQQAGQEARVNLDEARAEARQIVEELDASLENTVAETTEALDEQHVREELRRAELAAQARLQTEVALAAEALMRANMIKMAVAEHYMSMGDWPSGLADLGLGVPTDHAGGSVASIAIEPDGAIAIALTDEVAPGAMLRLVPQARRSGQIEWTCRARGYPAASRIPACRD